MSHVQTAISILDITHEQAYKLRNRYINIQYRCGKIKGYLETEFKLGSFKQFCEWIKSQGGLLQDYECCRHLDKGDYSYDNIVWMPKESNLRQKAAFYLITDMQNSTQTFDQAGLEYLFEKHFDITLPSRQVYKYVDSDKLFMSRFKISKVSI